jgi:RHS repeat-associated protein
VGSITGYLNNSGMPAVTFTYRTFGELGGQTGAATNFPIGFGGGYTDYELKLVNHGARYYSGLQGRFTSRDREADSTVVDLFAAPLLTP